LVHEEASRHSSEKLKERSDELIRANNERVLKSEQNAASASSDARLKKAEQDLQEAWDALPGSTQAELQELKNTYGIEKATGELKLQKILDLTAELLLRAGAPDASYG
jgi:predicted metal-dependent hydrolase